MEAHIDQVRGEVVGLNVGDKACRKEYGIAPWHPFEMPTWFMDPKERSEVWRNTKIDFFCAGGSTDPLHLFAQARQAAPDEEN